MRVLLTYMLFLTAASSFAQSRVEILRADRLVYDREVGRYQRCIGNVQFKQGNVYMDCDSAWFYEDKNLVEAFGKIRIRQRDTFDLRGEYLRYDGDERRALVEEKVVLSDGEMTLRTPRVDYDLNDKTAQYWAGGNIINGEDTLYSDKGIFYSRSKTFIFRDSVELHNPKYVMYSDTLHYQTDTKLATFYGPTYIYSEDNTIYCNYGWYNTQSDLSQFSKGAYLEGKHNKLEADSLVYDRNKGIGKAFRNLILTDTAEKLIVYGGHGIYFENEKRTVITSNPWAKKEFDDDTMFLSADTMVEVNLSDEERQLLAFHHVRIYKSDMKALSDSMCYHYSDSTITLYTDPILWTDSTQVTGDTIRILRNSEGIERLFAYQNGFMIDRDRNGKYNQIKGRAIEAVFEEGELDRILVKGNGQSVYYALEDSTNYSGVNDIVCGNMVIYTDTSGQIGSITFLNTPKATFYPLESFPEDKSKLQGFNWLGTIRPKRTDFASK